VTAGVTATNKAAPVAARRQSPHRSRWSRRSRSSRPWPRRWT
jgi:hypothetical protein